MVARMTIFESQRIMINQLEPRQTTRRTTILNHDLITKPLVSLFNNDQRMINTNLTTTDVTL